MFNSEEFKDKEHSVTTAAEAQMNAPTKVEAMHVSENVERVKGAANQAASVAKTLGSNFTGEPATAVDQFKANVSRTTEAAVTEGRQDVQQAKIVSAGYVEQAKSLANSALETAQNYLPVALGGKPAEPVSRQEAPSLVDQAKNTAANLYESAKETAQSSSSAVRSHIETAKSATQPHLENVKQSAQVAVDSALPHIENAKAKVQGSMGIVEPKGDIPSTSAPLESGPHTVKSPYPTTTTKPKDIAANEGQPMQTRN